MKRLQDFWNSKTELNRLDRVAIHLLCLWRDRKYGWHLAGVWRELTWH
jgi:hypothetical protein